ncbi:MAG: glutamine synthetase III [Proteobacteria bacterium]|nr:glutamine synthetase III [Pseudomonadota bacterium]
MFHPIRTVERPRTSENKLARVTEYFGTNVFDLRAMRKRLSTQDVETLETVMKFGGKIDGQLASRIANAVREWASEKGASHYCHWFQPQTGSTAEKHDAFLWFDKAGSPIERFTGAELLQSEPDASSFPSGGLRATFEARGYTGWDPSSPMFIMETESGKTLYIPSVFISYHGEALDYKTPLLRSNAAINAAAVKTLKLLGEKNITNVTTNIGAEQEFFVIEKRHFDKRPDLLMTGRTVLGYRPAKGQELEDHYFGHIPSRVQSLINEVELELYKLGVPLKTRHNEVAPHQFEIAPIFEGANIAADHNQLLMMTLKQVAVRHGFVVLFHEKPFAGVNGSGKHLNWSMADNSGRNLLDPGHTPHENIVFLTFLSGVLQGIADHDDVLRSAIATTGNDHRLGANEAPPAIISAFLGNTLDRILNAIESGKTEGLSVERLMLDLGVSHLQEVAKDNTDRNRTSPFAFTGNKFEFRAVGSSSSINYPATVLNAAVASGINKLNAKLEAKAKAGLVSPEDTIAILRGIIADTKKIRFEGNGYSQEWRDEATRRGLNNFVNCPAALAVLSNKKKTEFLVETKVFNHEDIHSRLAIQLERYIKQRLIEVNCTLELAETSILPAAFSYLNELTSLVKSSLETIGVDTGAKEVALVLAKETSLLTHKLQTLHQTLDKVTNGDAMDHDKLFPTATALAEVLYPKLEELRETADRIESLLPRTKLPYPSYSDMLFGIG